ncbi:hypothetical protein TNCT_679431 [Trichonephila clavata]|uniref:Uncharacterized protein n=1 Tax=Trichonephila clavata TaxID=2740835 RepID=A0A8X6L8M9_TRICU|nr:hypothetical protein TNCT_679431 [Trichonephila clavata]
MSTEMNSQSPGVKMDEAQAPARLCPSLEAKFQQASWKIQHLYSLIYARRALGTVTVPAREDRGIDLTEYI